MNRFWFFTALLIQGDGKFRYHSSYLSRRGLPCPPDMEAQALDLYSGNGEFSDSIRKGIKQTVIVCCFEVDQKTYKEWAEKNRWYLKRKDEY